jgi:hypothetical protein
MMPLTRTTALVLLLATLAAAQNSFDFYTGACAETCCCKVCSSPTVQAFPYGLLDMTSGANPVAPKVLGATCTVPTWADMSVNDTLGNPFTSPNTLFWAEFQVFGDYQQHTMGTTCDCCRLSLDTNCAEEAPIARVPQSFRVSTGSAIAENTTSIIFQLGVALSIKDYAELRNDTHCGYGTPAYTIRSAAETLVPSDDATEATWHIDRLPTTRCYHVCYYQGNLTTPGWYDLGSLTVHPLVQPEQTFFVDEKDVVLEGNSVTLSFFGEGLLNVFSDIAEIRLTSSTCQSGATGLIETTSTGTNGGLNVVDGADWCHPPVVQGITSFRPLRYVAVQYADCPAVQRLYVSRLKWTLTLPVLGGGTYLVCYRRNSTIVTDFVTSGTLTIPTRLTALQALQALYAATGGNAWHQTLGWDGAAECEFFGVRCDSSSKVVSILLGRNNLVGTLPAAFFLSDLFSTVTDLKLDMNELSGDMPREIGAWRKLRVLDVAYNQLTGSLPITLQRTEIQILYVSANAFDGTVPLTLSALSQKWTEENSIVDTVAPALVHKCPTDTLVCSDKGSTDAGVFTCGHASISEAECVIRGCCFNAQAPLTFGGTACFTKKSSFYSTHPTCQNSLNCLVQYVAPQ